MMPLENWTMTIEVVLHLNDDGVATARTLKEISSGFHQVAGATSLTISRHFYHRTKKVIFITKKRDTFGEFVDLVWILKN